MEEKKSRTLISPQEIIARFQVSSPPPDFESVFGPVAAPTQHQPLKYKSIKRDIPIKLPRAENQQQQQPAFLNPENPIFQPKIVPFSEIFKSSPEVVEPPVARTSSPPAASEPPKVISFQEIISSVPQGKEEAKPQQIPTQSQPPAPVFSPQPMQMGYQQFQQSYAQYAQFFQYQQFQNQINQPSIVQTQQQQDFTQQYFQPQPQPQQQFSSFSFPLPLTPHANFEQQQQQQQQVSSFDKPLNSEIYTQQQNEIQQQQPSSTTSTNKHQQRVNTEQKIAEISQMASLGRAEAVNAAVKPKPTNIPQVIDFKSIESQEIQNNSTKVITIPPPIQSTSSKQEEKEKEKETEKFTFKPMEFKQPVVDFKTIEQEFSSQAKQTTQSKNTKQSEENITYQIKEKDTVKAKAEMFSSIEEEEQLRLAIEASLRETGKPTKQEPVITYKPAVQTITPKMETILQAAEKSIPKQEPKAEKTKKGGKFAPYVPPKKEPLPPPVQPKVPSFDTILNEASYSQSKNSTNQTIPIVDKQKKGKGKFVPFEATQQQQPFYSPKQQVSIPSADINSILKQEEKRKSTQKPTPSPPPAVSATSVISSNNESSNKKKKFIPYVEPVKANPYAKEVSPIFSNKNQKGPSFNDLFSEESKSKPSASTSSTTTQNITKTGNKKAKKTIISENLSAYHVSKYDPEAKEEERLERKQALNKQPNSLFSQIIAEEEKKSNRQNPKQNVTYRTNLGPSLRSSNFEELLRKESERETAFDKSTLEVKDSTYSTSEFKERRPKQKAHVVDDGLFWGDGELAAPIEEEPIYSSRKEYSSSLAKPAPGQHLRTSAQIADIQSRLEQSKRNAPLQWLQTQLCESGLEMEESQEISEVIVTKNRVQMLESLRSLIPDQSKASNICSNFFRKFPRPIQ